MLSTKDRADRYSDELGHTCMKAGVRLQRHIGLGHPTMCYTDASDGNQIGTIKPSISRRDSSKIRPAMRLGTCTEPAYLQLAKQMKF